MEIITVVGARPQFIKAAVVSRVMRAHGGTVRERIVHTGQHFDPNMSDVFFAELGIPEPFAHLGIGGGTHGQNTGRMIEQIESVLQASKPDWLLVYGDTDSTLAGAVAAAKLHVPIAHVEAGLRSFNREMPEEVNRVLTDHCSELLLTPTAVADANLRREGVDPARIKRVGDVMYDAALHYSARSDSESSILERLGLAPGTFVLATIHRQDNTDSPQLMREITAGLANCGSPVVWPLHPRTRKRLEAHGISLPDTILTCDPVGYLDMVRLEKSARVIATDSGGVQKEAFFHGVPCVTVRDETEWVELVSAGWNQLVEARAEKIAEAIEGARKPAERDDSIYGDGTAGARILDELLKRSNH